MGASNAFIKDSPRRQWWGKMRKGRFGARAKVRGVKPGWMEVNQA